MPEGLGRARVPTGGQLLPDSCWENTSSAEGFSVQGFPEQFVQSQRDKEFSVKRGIVARRLTFSFTPVKHFC